MDYEKKYKKALEWIREVYPTLRGAAKEDAELYFPELKESKDEQSKNWILEYLYDGLRKSDEQFKDQFKVAIAWLEKQGEHANFRNKIQIGDKVTRNQDGVLVNLSQLNRVAKPADKQGEQKPTEWSEEDEAVLDALIRRLKGEDVYVSPHLAAECLKSLKDRVQPQSHWKPRDEQIKVCKEVYANLLSAKGLGLGTVNSELNRLEEELKKLREE